MNTSLPAHKTDAMLQLQASGHFFQRLLGHLLRWAGRSCSSGGTAAPPRDGMVEAEVLRVRSAFEK